MFRHIVLVILCNIFIFSTLLLSTLYTSNTPLSMRFLFYFKFFLTFFDFILKLSFYFSKILLTFSKNYALLRLNIVNIVKLICFLLNKMNGVLSMKRFFITSLLTTTLAFSICLTGCQNANSSQSLSDNSGKISSEKEGNTNLNYSRVSVHDPSIIKADGSY